MSRYPRAVAENGPYRRCDACGLCDGHWLISVYLRTQLKRPLGLEVQPAEFVPGQGDIEAGHGGAGFFEDSGTDQGEGWEGLAEDVREGDVDRENVFAGGEFDGALAAAEVVVG